MAKYAIANDAAILQADTGKGVLMQARTDKIRSLNQLLIMPVQDKKHDKPGFFFYVYCTQRHSGFLKEKK